jgi:hypothetical protein
METCGFRRDRQTLASVRNRSGSSTEKAALSRQFKRNAPRTLANMLDSSSCQQLHIGVTWTI